MIRKAKSLKKELVKKSYKAVCIITAFISSVFLWRYNISPHWEKGYKGYMTLFLVGVIFCVTYWIFVKMYQAQKIGIYKLLELSYSQVLSFFMADIVLIVETVVWFHGVSLLRPFSFLFAFAAQIAVSVLNIFVHNRLFARYDEARKVMIIYGNEDYRQLTVKMRDKGNRYDIVSCIPDSTPLDEIKAAIKGCEGVYLYDADESLKRKLVLYCDGIGKDIYLSLDVEDLLTMGFDVSHTFDTPFIRTRHSPERWYYPAVKRALDIVLSVTALIISSPLFLITALAIKLCDRGPVFYRQERLTKDRRTFKIIKFRSMVVDAEDENARLASRHDDRITAVGRRIRATRIDELPQLFNVIKGDMSLVGPRPERPEIEKMYLREIPEFGMRLKVKAGLTGYAQVFGKYNTTPKDKLKLDLLYINQRSLLLDFKLLFYTLKIIFTPEATEGIEDDKTTAGSR